MNSTFNINTDAVVRFSNRLEQLSSSALPVVVRQTLNSAAFDVKKNTMPEQARSTFTIRQANFFKATSKVNMATGFSVNDMKAEVGFTATNKYANQAVADLAQQEAGGTIAGRSFIPMDTARAGGSKAGVITAKNRLTNIQKIVNARNTRGANKAQQFIKAAVQAGVGGYVLAEDRKGQNILWRVNTLSRDRKWATRMELTPLYNFSAGRKVRVSQTEFMERATEKTAEKMQEFFIKNAERKFEKALE